MTPLQALAERAKRLARILVQTDSSEAALQHCFAAIDELAAARTVLAQGEGWVMVPKEPTEVMRLAGNASYWASQLANRGEYRYEDDDAGVVYRAMIAAAPKVPT